MYKINQFLLHKHYYLQITQGIANMPKSLYVIGDLPAIRKPTVVIIGTRKPSSYGQEVAYQLAYDLAKRGVVIVSGLALGVDAIAHKAALDAGGTTIAVMPCGLDNIQPRTNYNLAERIVQNGGALVSEYSVGHPIYLRNFIQRNRIVAAIADGTLVIEAAAKSGTLHTAGFALDYGRPVMAVPGAITNPMSSGTNQLIATGARLITSAVDVLNEIGAMQPAKQAQLPLASTPQEAIIIKLIATGTRSAEDLQQQSTLPPAEFAQTLTMLEISGIVRPLGNNKWALA